MKPELQRIKIAEACGWYDLFEQDESILGKHEPESMGRDYFDSPDYLNSLDAMHEAEKVLTEDQTDSYRQTLMGLMITHKKACGFSDAISATAAQRAEAFLRTLSLWQE